MHATTVAMRNAPAIVSNVARHALHQLYRNSPPDYKRIANLAKLRKADFEYDNQRKLLTHD